MTPDELTEMPTSSPAVTILSRPNERQGPGTVWRRGPGWYAVS